MATIPKINLWRIQTDLHRLMRNDVRYKLGAKARLTADIDSIRAVDCSGLIRFLVYRATDGLVIPDGSWIQKEWLQKRDPGTGVITQVKYSEVFNKPDSFYIATLDPKGGKAGHIWGINDRYTVESYGGVGPGERPWDTPFLKREVDSCFRWEHVWVPNAPVPR